MDYTSPKFDKYRIWIREARENNLQWDELMNGRPDSFKSLSDFLQNMKITAFWNIDEEDWKNFVYSERVAEEKSREFEIVDQSSLLVDGKIASDYTVPEMPESAWQKYRERLLKNGFMESSVNEIEKSTLSIMRLLQKNGKEVRKGLVMGNVQSGKTANMAALMAMAADWGWNMFIILSGTIENLRLQTQNRLLEDLTSDNSIIRWQGIEKPTPNAETTKTSNLNFKNNSAYFTVCLKNKTRLRNLVEWLQYDQKRKKDMRVIIIDDEADQAGINTLDVDKSERNAINRLIVNLVNNCRHNGKPTDTVFGAMNYIGYTATPYANFLNETAEESLYPKDFIATLSNPPEYFGPQAIFGVEGAGDSSKVEQFDGVNIVRDVLPDEVKLISEIHQGKSADLPVSLKKSIGWFLAATAALRHSNHNKPVSMLVHTSQRQEHHGFIAKNIERWIRDSRTEVVEYARLVYEEETLHFTKESFAVSRPSYPGLDNILDYPSYPEIIPSLNELIDQVTPIPLNEDNEYEFQKTLHLCIDNCANNGIDDEGMFKRLVYPTSKQLKSMKFAPAFIVVGGATLSRGLTIEGLVSTYFLREGRQADTLMQMGRWFGYRRGYELYPRIWMTELCNSQFRFLSTLDYELRNEIKDMVVRGVAPTQYGPKIINSPKVKFLRITAKNKMQKAEYTDLDYSGSHNQTVVFENDEAILKSNLQTTQAFLESLSAPSYSEKRTALVWRNIDHRDIFEKFLYKFKFAANNVVFSDVEALYDWVDQITLEEKLGPWNIVAAGLQLSAADEDKIWRIGDFEVTKVIRTRRKTVGNKFDIGVLRGPRDMFADIETSKLTEEQKVVYDSLKDTDYYEKRRAAGLDEIPQLLIYRIDKNSKARTEENNTIKKDRTTTRQDLNAVEDVIGICITIPGAKRNGDLAKRITVKLDSGFNENDLE